MAVVEVVVEEVGGVEFWKDRLGEIKKIIEMAGGVVREYDKRYTMSVLQMSELRPNKPVNERYVL